MANPSSLAQSLAQNPQDATDDDGAGLVAAPAALQAGLARRLAAQDAAGVALSRTLAQGMNPQAEQYRQDYLQRQQNQALAHSNNQALALGLAPTTAPPSALPAAPGVASPQGTGAARDPSTLSFAAAPRPTSGAVQSLADYLVTPRTQAIPAAKIAKVAPEDVAAIRAAGMEAGAAQKQLGESQAAGSELEAGTEKVRGALQGVHATEIAQAAAQHDAKIQGITERLEGASRDLATSRLDPNRWWKGLGTGDKIRFSIANMFEAFANGFSGGHIQNQALETINQHISSDLMAQRQEIEAKKGRIEDLHGLLADTYKRFGNMDQAMAAAHALALQQVDSEQRHYAAMSNSQIKMAESRAASAKIQEDQALQMAQLYTYRPGGTATTNPLVDYLTYSKNWAKGDQKTPLMSFAEYTQSVGGGGHSAAGLVEGSPDARYRKYQDGLLEKGETPLSREEWEKSVSGATATAPGASIPKPQSVAFNPMRNVQNTDAYAKEQDQARYNAALTRAVLTKFPKGIERNQQMVDRLQKAYSIEPGDTQETIDRKMRAAQADLGMALPAQGPSVGFTPAVR